MPFSGQPVKDFGDYFRYGQFICLNWGEGNNVTGSSLRGVHLTSLRVGVVKEGALSDAPTLVPSP